jgi:hypothetical protein
LLFIIFIDVNVKMLKRSVNKKHKQAHSWDREYSP